MKSTLAVRALENVAAMESFFSLLQKNVLDRRSWTTREQLRIAIVAWIGRGDVELATMQWVHFFNHDRPHESIDDLTPAQAEEVYYHRHNSPQLEAA